MAETKLTRFRTTKNGRADTTKPPASPPSTVVLAENLYGYIGLDAPVATTGLFPIKRYTKYVDTGEEYALPRGAGLLRVSGTDMDLGVFGSSWVSLDPDAVYFLIADGAHLKVRAATGTGYIYWFYQEG